MVSTAHQAVESALAIADHFTTGGQRSVSLQFSVSGVDLAVHVELRGDAVHTTFRTDSPELRTALQHEWQSVAASNPSSQPQRLADPVFTASSTGSGSFASSHSAADQRDPGARQQPLFDQSATPRATARTQTTTPSAAETARATVPSNRFAPAQEPGRLHAFA